MERPRLTTPRGGSRRNTCRIALLRPLRILSGTIVDFKVALLKEGRVGHAKRDGSTFRRLHYFERDFPGLIAFLGCGEDDTTVAIRAQMGTLIALRQVDAPST